MRRSRAWPRYLTCCAKCLVERTKAEYTGRGLCRKCYDRARNAGTLHNWSCYNPKTEQVVNLALRACMLVGVTQVSEELDVPKKQLVKWAQGKVPKNYRYTLTKYIQYIQSLKTEGFVASEEREELFKGDQPEFSLWQTIGDDPFTDW